MTLYPETVTLAMLHGFNIHTTVIVAHFGSGSGIVSEAFGALSIEHSPASLMLQSTSGGEGGVLRHSWARQRWTDHHHTMNTALSRATILDSQINKLENCFLHSVGIQKCVMTVLTGCRKLVSILSGIKCPH